jgi:hypothetical protein
MARYPKKPNLDSSHVRGGYYWRFVEWPWRAWTELDGQGWQLIPKTLDGTEHLPNRNVTFDPLR